MKATHRDFLCYLAGPISGLRYAEGQSWRDYVAANLPLEIRAMSPLRSKEGYLDKLKVIEDSYEENPMTSAVGLTTRDRNDCMRSDAVLFNLLGAQRVSIGTCIELGWADAKRIPIILVMEENGNLHDHAMVRSVAGYRVTTLDAAITLLEALLLPEGEGRVVQRCLKLGPLDILAAGLDRERLV